MRTLAAPRCPPPHSAPPLRQSVGFDKPILHGLCSFGFAARAVLHAFCDGDANRFKWIKVRVAARSA